MMAARHAIGDKRFAWALLGVVLLAVLVYESRPRQIASDLSSVGTGLIAIVALEFVVDGFNTLGWWFTFPPGVRGGGFSRLFFVRLAGTALNQTLPAASIGGEPAKVYLLGPEFPVANAIATVMLSSTIFSLSKVAFIASAAILTWRRLQIPHALALAILIGFIVTLCGVVTVLALQVRGFTAATRAILAWMQVPNRWRRAVADFTLGVDEEVSGFYRSRPGDLMLAIISHELAFCCGVMQIWLMLGWLGLPRELGTSVAIESLTMLLGFVTFIVPGGIGVQEGSSLLAFTALGLPASAGIAVGIAFRLTSIVGAASGLVAFTVLKGRKPEIGSLLTS